MPLVLLCMSHISSCCGNFGLLLDNRDTSIRIVAFYNGALYALMTQVRRYFTVSILAILGQKQQSLSLAVKQKVWTWINGNVFSRWSKFPMATPLKSLFRSVTKYCKWVISCYSDATADKSCFLALIRYLDQNQLTAVSTSWLFNLHSLQKL